VYTLPKFNHRPNLEKVVVLLYFYGGASEGPIFLGLEVSHSFRTGLRRITLSVNKYHSTVQALVRGTSISTHMQTTFQKPLLIQGCGTFLKPSKGRD
jgi:hypothetical protein